MAGVLVTVFGPFNSRALVEMSATDALALVDAGQIDAQPTAIIKAARRDISRIRKSSPELANSALAQSVLSLAYEIANPYNSATSKAACAKAMMEALEQLRALTPPAPKKDAIDAATERHAARRRGADAAHQRGS